MARALQDREHEAQVRRLGREGVSVSINLQHPFTQNLESEVERNDEEVGDQEQDVRYTQAGQQPVEQIVHGPELNKDE